MTRLIDLPTLAQLVHHITPARFMTELAEHLHSDYLRWQDFDKTARVASHSAGGVIVTDWYVNPNSPGERMKLTVSILDQDLRADALPENIADDTARRALLAMLKAYSERV